MTKPLTQPHFSIILPVRNGMPYIKDAVHSVLNQSYKNFNLIILDNNSSDGTLEWISDLKESRIKIYTSKDDLNIVESWGRIVDIKKNKFMTMFAHDDILKENFLSEITKLIIKYPKANLYQTNGELIDKLNNVIRSCKKIPEEESIKDYMKARFLGKRDVFGTGYVMRSSDYDSIGGIPKFNGLSFADDALWIMLIGDGLKVCNKASSISVRVHSNSESATKPSNWEGFLIALKQFSNFLEQSDQTKLFKDIEMNDFKKEFFKNYLLNIYILCLVDFSIKKKIFSRNDEILFEEAFRTLSNSSFRNIKKKPKAFTVLILFKFVKGLLPFFWQTYSKFRSI